MPRGNWIAHVIVTNPDKYKQYALSTGDAFKRLGRQHPNLPAEGGESRPRHVVIAFPSLQTISDCYASPDYEAAPPVRSTLQ